MKGKIYFFIMVILLLTMIPLTVNAANVLIYDENSDDHVAQTACTNLGHTCTVADSSNFVTQLGSGSWDLVIMDLPGNRPLGDWQTPLANYINSGGRAIQTGWDPADFTTLATIYEVSIGSVHDPLNLYQWSGHSLFTTPNVVPSTMVPADDNWADNGFYLTTIGSSVAAGGFTFSPTVGQAAIVIGNSGRTIFNGFLFDDYYPSNADSDGKDDIVELVENEITFLVGGPQQSIPTMNEWGVIIFITLAGISAIYYLKKQRV